MIMSTETATLELGGMHCEHCAAAIEKRLRKTEGVAEVSVSFPDATAEVTFDAARTQVGALIAAIEDEGYQAKASSGA
jgi:copper chaperone CopZ